MTHTRTGLCVTSTLTLLLVAPALAQEPNPRGGLTFSQELRLSDNADLAVNPDGTTLIARTGLGFEYLSDTRVQSLRLSLGTDLEGAFGADDDDFDFVNDRAALSYVRESKNAGLDFQLGVRSTPLEDIRIGTADDLDALVIDGGRRDRRSLDFGFDIGRNARTSLEVDLSSRETDYVGTSDPDLRDSETRTIDARAGLDLTKSLTASVLAGTRDTDEEGGISRDTSYVGVGLAGETRAGFTFSGDITYDRTQTTGGATPRDEDGIGISLALTQDRPLGAYSLTLGSRIDEAGRASRIALGREMALKAGALSWSVGVTDYDDTDPGLTGSLSWVQETSDGSLTARLSRDQRPTDSVPYADTRIGLTYAGELSELSRWSASIDYFAQDQLGGDDDGDRTQATVSYSRDLAPDWQLNTGYEYTRIDPISGSERDRNSVFVNIQRDVTFGF